MSIVQCEECFRDMSDQAPACPHCGMPNTLIPVTATKKSNSGCIIASVIFAIFFIMFVWLLGDDELPSDSNISSSNNTPNLYESSELDQDMEVIDDSASITENDDVISVSIVKLMSDYENNEVGADNRYQGNYVAVTGTVVAIKKDIFDELYLLLGSGGDFEIRQLQASFDDEYASKLGELQRGQRITVVCQITGLMLNIQTEDCVIAD